MGGRSVCPTCGREIDEVRHTGEFAAQAGAPPVVPAQVEPPPRVKITTELAAQACSYCGKGLDQVRRLLTGRHAMICDECVSLCHMVLTDELPGYE